MLGGLESVGATKRNGGFAMADGTIRPKRSPVKPNVMNIAVQDAQRPTGRPDLQFIEDTLGHALDPYVLSLYHGGYFDDEPTRGALTPERILEANVNALKARRDMDDHIRHLAARAARVKAAAIPSSPADYTCTACGGEFEHLKRIGTKLCQECARERLERDIAEERAKVLAAREHEPEPTTEEWRVICRDWRTEVEQAQQRAARIPRLRARIKEGQDLYYKILRNPAREAGALRMRFWNRSTDRGLLIDRYRTRLDEAERGYARAKNGLRWSQDIHPAHRYCRNDGLELPWSSDGYCDGKCEREVQQRGEVAFDMGPECLCGARLTGPDATPDNIAALPRIDEEIAHTYECLMSEPIDPDDYRDFGPGAACWRPVLHVPNKRPAWSYKERFVHALPLMPSDSTAALRSRPARALPSRFFETLEQEDDRRMLEWAAQFDRAYFSLAKARVGSGKGWIATGRVRATIDRLVGGERLIAHPGLKNHWRLTEQNENR
jgi:hypothetical protein